MIEKFLEAGGGYKKRHVLHGSDGHDMTGNTENNLSMSGADVVNHNL